MTALGFDNTPHAWELRDGMVDRYAEKIAAAADLDDLDQESAAGLSLLALASVAGQDDRVLAWAKKLGSAYRAACDRLLGLGGAS